MIQKYLKGCKNFWTVLPSQTDSTMWKEILRFRQELLPHLKFALGSSSKIGFWLDPWCGKGRLVDILSMDMMTALGGTHTKVSHYIRAEKWSLPPSSNSEVNKVWAYIKEKEIPKLGFFMDKWVWNHSATGEFSFKIAFQALRVHHSEVDWVDILWSSTCIPNYSCCSYRAVLGRLLTKDRLYWLHPYLVKVVSLVVLKTRHVTIYFFHALTTLISGSVAD